MNEEDFQLMLNPVAFQPFVVTMTDGFALPVNDPRDTLLTERTLVIKHRNRIYQFPFRSVAHVSEHGEKL